MKTSEEEYCYIDGDEMVIKRQDEANPIRIQLSETELQEKQLTS